MGRTVLIASLLVLALAIGVARDLASNQNGPDKLNATTVVSKIDDAAIDYVICCCQTNSGECCGKAQKCGGYIPGCKCIDRSYPK